MMENARLECVGIDAHSEKQQICHIRHNGCGICDVLHEKETNMDGLVPYMKANVPEGTSVLIEASTNSFRLHDMLTEAGYHVIVAEASTLSGRNRYDRINDKIDAYGLAKALATNTYHTVHVASKTTRAMRNEVKMYQRADKEVTRVSNQLWALCSQYLEKLPPSENKQKVSFYEKLLKDNAIPIEARHHFQHFLDNFKWAIQEKEYHQDEMKRYVCNDPETLKLLQIPGIGFTTAYALKARIESIKRFKTAAKLAAYIGLNPSQCSSGESEGSHHVSNYGHGYTKQLVVLAARAALSKGDTDLARWGRRLIMRNKNYNVVVCAVARKLIGIVWHVLNGHPIPNREGEKCMCTKLKRTLNVIPKEKLPEHGFDSYTAYAKDIVSKLYKDVPEWTEEQEQARLARREAQRLDREARKKKTNALKKRRTK